MNNNISEQQKELISIVIPVYNSEETILQCLSNVCGQTYRNIEILVVYLASKDKTLEKIKSFQDKRIKVIEQKSKTGPGGARNIGIKNACGQWIGFVEADDSLDKNFYEKLINAAKEYDCDIAQGEIETDNGHLWTAFSHMQVISSLKEKLSAIKNGASFDKLFRAKLLKENNILFAENLRWEDNPFIFKAFYFGKIVTVPGARYKYISEPENWTSSYKEKLKHDIFPITLDILMFFKKQQVSKGIFKLVKRKITDSYANSFIEEKDIYLHLMEIMDNPLFLMVIHYRKRLKIFRRKIKNKIKSLFQ